MELPQFWKKEPEKPSVIQIEDRWNREGQKRPLRINSEKLTVLAVRDFGFTPHDISRTKVALDSLFDIDALFNTTIGVEEIHRHTDRIAKPVEGEQTIFQLDPEAIRDVIPDFLGAGLPVDALAAHALRDALSLKKAYLDHATRITRTRKKSARSLAGVAASTGAGYFLSKRGVDLAAWGSLGGAAGFAINARRLRKKTDNDVSFRHKLGDEAEALRAMSSDEKSIEEWKKVVSGDSTD